MLRKAATTVLSMQTAGRSRWQQLAANAVTTAEQLARCFPIDQGSHAKGH